MASRQTNSSQSESMTWSGLRKWLWRLRRTSNRSTWMSLPRSSKDWTISRDPMERSASTWSAIFSRASLKCLYLASSNIFSTGMSSEIASPDSLTMRIMKIPHQTIKEKTLQLTNRWSRSLLRVKMRSRLSRRFWATMPWRAKSFRESASESLWDTTFLDSSAATKTLQASRKC